jgi:L-serine dehydratase
MTLSILNHVLGPVMHGPSSSHTAASYRMGLMAREMLSGPLKQAVITFDRQASFGKVFRQQGSDLAFACGLMGWPMEDPRFFSALDHARESGLDLFFELGSISESDHPNAVRMRLSGPKDEGLTLVGRSVGGGLFDFIRLMGRPVEMNGESHEVLVLLKESVAERFMILVKEHLDLAETPRRYIDGEGSFVQLKSPQPFAEGFMAKLRGMPGIINIWTASPVFYMQQGGALFNDSAGLLKLAQKEGLSLGRAALAYESRLLELNPEEVLTEMRHRWMVMQDSIKSGLKGELPGALQTLEPSAHKAWRAEQSGGLAIGGPHTRAAIRAMAVMHQNGAMGLVCAAPTGGSCGVLPAVAATLQEELVLDDEAVLLSLLAAGGVGLVFVAEAGTFAGEEAGCQVEIGIAGAMGAAAAVEAVGGNASKALEAAAISLQNTLGMPCDLVRSAVEIPCHTRNAAAASSALVCADLILGGYQNPIPFDETVRASMKVGRALPLSLRCTSQGGLAATPSALTAPYPASGRNR